MNDMAKPWGKEDRERRSNNTHGYANGTAGIFVCQATAAAAAPPSASSSSCNQSLWDLSQEEGNPLLFSFFFLFITQPHSFSPTLHTWITPVTDYLSRIGWSLCERDGGGSVIHVFLVWEKRERARRYSALHQLFCFSSRSPHSVYHYGTRALNHTMQAIPVSQSWASFCWSNQLDLQAATLTQPTSCTW